MENELFDNETELQKGLRETLADVEITYEDFTQTAFNVSSEITGGLDEIISNFQKDAIDREASDKELERYLFELGNAIYFLGTKLENLGIKDDVSKMLYKEKYNNTYLQNNQTNTSGKKLTISDLNAIAETESKYENIVNLLYDRIYSQVKLKMNAAYDLVNSIRKIISRRMQEQNLSSILSSQQVEE